MANSFGLIGAGIMSATLGVFLKQLIPDCKIIIYERLDKVGAESSDAWNNAGTGHAAYCELNYTPLREDGKVDLSKALKISQQFEESKQFWSFLKENHLISPDTTFINDIPHISFVSGEKNVEFLRKRYNAMTQYPLFEDMMFTRDVEEMKIWMPLLIEGRELDTPIAATRMGIGTDVNFGTITRSMIAYLEKQEGVGLKLGHEIEDVKSLGEKGWKLEGTALETESEFSENFDFVFIGAGGGALPLLEKSDIPESRGYGGFPVGGQWLKCTNPEIVKQHQAKVYGKAEEGSPPMSVPHLDTRFVDGNRSLLFGPYAGFSTKFLKNGSYLDLPLSIEAHNVWPMLKAGIKNISLTKYLIEQVIQSDEDRFEALQKYYPNAREEDWELSYAGQRVQIIKKDEKEGGVLKFGTEVVTNESKNLAALLGASPGASTSVSIMLSILDTCFPEKMQSKQWKTKLKEMIPSYGESLLANPELLKEVRRKSARILELTPKEQEWK